MGTWTIVNAVKGADRERFYINDTDERFQQGHVVGSLTETEFRAEFKKRGLSDSEIEERVTVARKPKS